MRVEAEIVVVGAGNAALAAAIEAADCGATPLVLEAAPYETRGGNSRFTGGLLRFAHSGLADVLTLVASNTTSNTDAFDVPPYPVEAMVADVERLCQRQTNLDLISIVARESRKTMDWYESMGVEFEFYEKYVEHEGRRSWPDGAVLKTLGGGPSLVAALFGAAEARGIEIRYEHSVVDLDFDSSGIQISVQTPDGISTIHADALVLGSGGFEASSKLRQRHLGEHWAHAKVRGTKYNTGTPLERMLERGAKQVGQWDGAHAVTVDASAPDVGDLSLGALTTRLSYPTGIMVNFDGRRFTDEGADFKLLTYARIGEEILRQPGGRALQIFDQQTVDLIESRYVLGPAPLVADSITDLAHLAGIDPQTLSDTVEDYNNGVVEGVFDPSILDGKGTVGVDPPKSNWALRLENPPYVAYVVACGITFTYGGLAIDARARVIDANDSVIPGVFATGEITGGFFAHNYPAGAGLMRGAVFGRIAGREAASLIGSHG